HRAHVPRARRSAHARVRHRHAAGREHARAALRVRGRRHRLTAGERMKQVIVVGLGNFGSAVAETLYTKGHDVTAVDLDEKAVDRIARRVSRAAVGDGRQIEVLEKIGAADADAGIVSTGDDITASILATLALRDLGVEEIYVKVISADHARVAEKLG